MIWQLLIDSSIQGVALGFSPLEGNRAGDVLWIRTAGEVGDSAGRLPLLYQEGLEALEIASEKMRGISIGAGPGSFTGLRVGMSYAFGLATGLSAINRQPILWRGSSSLVAVFKSLCDSDERQTVVLPSTKTTGYIATKSKSSERVEVSLLNLEDPEATAKILHGTKTTVIGSWPLLTGSLVPGAWSIIDALAASMVALSGMANEGAKQWPAGFSENPPNVNYMKKSTVEERADQQGANV